MASQDLHTDILQVVARNLQVISLNTTNQGNIIDTQFFEALEFIVFSGTITEGTFTIQLQEGDDPALADAVTVPAAFVLGSITFNNTLSNSVRRIGYVGKKRYVRLNIISSGMTGGTALLGAIAIKGYPRHAPTAAA